MGGWLLQDAGPLHSGWRDDEVEKVSRRGGLEYQATDRKVRLIHRHKHKHFIIVAQRNAKIANYDFGAIIVDLPQ